MCAAMMEPDEGGEDRVLPRLRALASPVRLQILRALVVPMRAPDVRVRAAGGRAGLDADRFVGRTTVIEHLDVLEKAGLVRRVGEAYAVDQQSMVALLQDLGDLARLRALVEVDVEETLGARGPEPHALPPPPRVLVGNGPEAGRATALTGDGPWRVGRGADVEVPLAHDPHASRLHLVLERSAGGFLARVAPTAKNAVLVDFARVGPGESAELRCGSLLSVGATLLVLQT